jgi:hypothetical protein
MELIEPRNFPIHSAETKSNAQLHCPSLFHEQHFTFYLVNFNKSEAKSVNFLKIWTKIFLYRFAENKYFL